MQTWMSEAIVAAIRAAWDAGSPLAGGDIEALAAYADRRMRSFARRAKKSHGRMAQIDDLGKGLAQFFGDADTWSTPLQEDFRYLAAQIFDAAAEAPWIHACDLYPIGSTLTGTVIEVQSFGLFVSLPETGVAGFVSVPNLFPHHDAPAAESEWPDIGGLLTCTVLSHAVDRRRIDLACS